MIKDSLENLKKYQNISKALDAVIAEIQSGRLETLPEGRYELDGKNLYYMIQDYETHEADTLAWEVHRDYLDIHYMIEGNESIGVGTIPANAWEGYNEAIDCANYEGTGDMITLHKGDWLLVNEAEGHKPRANVDHKDERVRKMCVKIHRSVIR